MKIYSGLKNGAVLQRDEDNLCKITVRADFCGTPHATFGYFEQLDDNEWSFKGVFIGGPYEITVSDDNSKMAFTEIYVGDVWLLAGQSNMEGAGWPLYEDRLEEINQNPHLRALYLEEEWHTAKPIMSNLSKSTCKLHQDKHNEWIDSIKERNIIVRDIPPYEIQRRIGPGLWFAEEMYKLTDGVPQGLILSAVGGSNIRMWIPDCESKNYFDEAARRVYLAGNNIKGLYWSQGEGNPNWEIYPEQIRKIRSSLCEQLGVKEIPFVQMQSFKFTIGITDESENQWSSFREMQRNMQYILPLTETVATNDLELSDCIHLSAASQKICGKRAANAMYYLVTGIGYPQPKIENIKLEKAVYEPDSGTVVTIKYTNLCGDLKSSGVPFGFTYRKSGADENPGIQNLTNITLKKNAVIIGIEKNIKEVMDYELFYGFGHSFYCNITDGANRAIPAMGPIKIKDYLE
jgi:sialate O-acetylesterase